MNALTFDRFGGPEVLRYGSRPDPIVKPGEVLVRTEAIGLNFADVYRRKGTYHLAGEPPFIAGYEAAGVVVSVGSGVAELRPGDRVGFADVPYANAELVAVDAARAIPLPDFISCETAAAVLLQGLTAHYLTHDSARVRPGDTMLVHAGAGGVGQLLIQIGKLLGARVVAITSSDAKAAVARGCGADAVLVSSGERADGFAEKVRAHSRELTGGEHGVDVVYDSVGSTLLESLAATRAGGTVVFYGMAGGDPPLIDPRMLMDRSLTLTGGDLWNVLVSREERVSRAEQLFQWLAQGRLRLAPPTKFRLSDGAEAHRSLEGRRTTGKIILIP